MGTVIKLKNSSTPGAIPTSSDLATGEVAINLSDNKIYTKDGASNINLVSSGTLSGLSDVADTTPSNNQLLSFNSSSNQWEPITSGSAITTTDDLAEGSTNLYYTDARVDARLPTSILNLNISDGTANHYLQTDGAGTFSFTDPLANATTITGPGTITLAPTPVSPATLGDVEIQGRIIVNNRAIFNGNMLFGNAVSDVIQINARWDNSLIPANAVGEIPTQDIGSSDRPWNEGHFKTIHIDDTSNLNIPEVLTDLSISDGTAGQLLSANGDGTFTFINPPTETNTTLVWTPGTSTLTYTDEEGTATNLDLSTLLDEDSRSIASGSLDAGTGIVTFTRDDATTFTMDLSALLDNTNLVTSVAGKTGDITLDTSEVTEHSSNLYYTDARVDARLPTSILSLNIADGTAGHYLSTDGAGAFSFSDPLANVSVVTGPGQLQLNPNPEGGGTLGDVRVNGRLIVTALARFNGNMEFGNTVSDTLTIGGRFGSHLVSQIETGDPPIYDLGEYNRTWRDGFFQGVTTTTLNSLNFPTSDGTAGHVLTTDGAGTISFTNVLNSGSLTDIGDVNTPGSTTPGNILVVHSSGTEYAWIPERKLLDDLNDINAGSPNDGDYLQWNNASSRWIPSPVISSASLEGLTDTLITSASTGQILVHNGSAWVNNSSIEISATDLNISTTTGDINLTTNSANKVITSGDLTVNGIGRFFGNMMLGNSITDELTVHGGFVTSLRPSVNLTEDIGSATRRWNVGYFNSIDVTDSSNLGAQTLAELNDVTAGVNDGDLLTYNASSGAYEFQAGFNLTVPGAASDVNDGEVLEWDLANNEFVVKDLYDLSTSNRISREETATQVIYRFQ